MRHPNSAQRALLAQWRNTPEGQYNRVAVDAKRIGMVAANRRRELGLTQVQLGALVGLQRNHVGRFETGASVPSLMTIERFCTALGMRVSQLFEGV